MLRELLRARAWGALLLVLFGATSTLLGGCDEEPCEKPPVRVRLVPESNPSLGRYSGTLTWLQTGEETTLDVELVPKDEIVTTRCGTGQAPVVITMTSGDGVVNLDYWESETIDASGRFHYGATRSSVAFHTPTLVVAGKIPEAPDILERNPVSHLDLAPGDGPTMDIVIRVWSMSDDFQVANGTVTRLPVP